MTTESSQLINSIPGAKSAFSAYLTLRRAAKRLLTRPKPAGQVFTEIYRRNKWGAKESISGTGSDLAQTETVRDQIPVVCHDFDIHTMLDIPCGDFNWMQHVPLDGIAYTGADIVAELAEQNARHETSTIHFRTLNLIHDTLPRADLVFCRDCLVHLSFADVFSALRNVCQSGSTYLLTTTFTNRRRNGDIATGQWRPLNLEAAPFYFSPPLRTINEHCSEAGGAWNDKSLGMWKVSDIAACLAEHQAI